jgi:hypothetical protein
MRGRIKEFGGVFRGRSRLPPPSKPTPPPPQEEKPAIKDPTPVSNPKVVRKQGKTKIKQNKENLKIALKSIQKKKPPTRQGLEEVENLTKAEISNLEIGVEENQSEEEEEVELEPTAMLKVKTMKNIPKEDKKKKEEKKEVDEEEDKDKEDHKDKEDKNDEHKKLGNIKVALECITKGCETEEGGVEVAPPLSISFDEELGNYKSPIQFYNLIKRKIYQQLKDKKIKKNQIDNILKQLLKLAHKSKPQEFQKIISGDVKTKRQKEMVEDYLNLMKKWTLLFS